MIIINPTASCTALVTHRKSVCTYTVTHSDWQSDNLGQKLISDYIYHAHAQSIGGHKVLFTVRRSHMLTDGV